MNVPPRSRGSAAFQAQRSFAARQVLLPAQPFIHTAGGSSLFLLGAAVAALVWANSPWSQSYFDLWETVISVDLGFLQISETLRHWVNDALMAVFFFVVGLEVKHELVRGELSSFQRAAFPAAAALGGMVVPAVIYISLNLDSSDIRGWGIPMATDIAFAIGVLGLLSSRMPVEARVFLLALAIADDIGAIMVIAIFYTQDLSPAALGVAFILAGVVFAMSRLGVRSTFLYIIVGTLLWVAVLKSGVHATIAGVVLGILTPGHPYFGINTFIESIERLRVCFREAVEREDEDATEVILRQMEELTIGTEAPAERLERVISPWSNYLVLPVFALANAGVVLSLDVLTQGVASTVTLGIILGLVVGKPLGIVGFSWLALRLRIASLPEGMRLQHIIGVGLLAGIGFTVSLFITELAFSDPMLISEAKLGILLASVLAGILGYAYLRISTKPASD
jgi:NhaA family Na+:H+ antiporter